MSLSFALTHGDVHLRVVRMRDVKALEKSLVENRDWLKKWEATSPDAPRSFDVKGMVRSLLKALDDRAGIPFVVQYQGEVVGQLNVANILYGSVSSAVIGYWISESVAGRKIAPTAVALVTDYLFNVVGLHRVEIDIRPENLASLRVVEKLGFRYEGLKQNYIHIDGAFRDHYVFALTHEEVFSGVMNRWLRNEVPKLSYPWHQKI
ncbi:MAG: GNAT family N-acetyltransferase [Micrococcales bacterium]